MIGQPEYSTALVGLKRLAEQMTRAVIMNSTSDVLSEAVQRVLLVYGTVAVTCHCGRQFDRRSINWPL